MNIHKLELNLKQSGHVVEWLRQMMFAVLQLEFEKGRVLIQKRAFSACSDMLRGHF